MSIDDGSGATHSQRRSGTGVLVSPGNGSTTFPLSVARASKAAEDGSPSNVVTVTMYF